MKHSGFYSTAPTRGQQVAIGTVVSLLAAGIFFAFLNGCGVAVNQALVECKLRALDELPRDPFTINGHDVANLVARLENCKKPIDGGAP